MTPAQILSDLKNGKFAPIYLLMGEEPYYIDLISDYIEEHALDAASRDFDQTVVYGKDTTMREVMQTARRFPMFGTRQVVIVKEAQHLGSFDDLNYYLQQPQKSTVLVFCYKYGSLDKRLKLLKEIEKTGVLMESAKIRDYQVVGWITDYVRQHKLNIDSKAVALLAEYLGTDLSKIINELHKLIIGCGGKTITADLVESNVGISKDYNVFELQKALVKRDVLKANRIIRYFAANPKNNPLVMVLAQLFKFFSNLMIYHYLGDKQENSVAVALKISPFFVRDYKEAAQSFNARRTMNAISYIREAAARQNGVDVYQMADEDILKELIFKILH